MELARAEIIVTGLVQGVFYRVYTEQEAARLGLTGWVRNNIDGSVGIAAEGEKENLRKLVQWCALGPPGARVDDVQVEWSESRGRFDQFSIKY